MKVFITGGAGYVGYSLIRYLLNQVPEVREITVYDNLSRKNYALFSGPKIKDKSLRFIPGELLDGRSLTRAVAEADAVVHLAAKVTTPFADNEAHFFDQVNHWGTAQLVQAIRDAPSIQRFIYLSSVSVYGHHPTSVNEETSPHPDSFYGHAKWRGEEQLVRLPENCKTFTLRAGNLYGFNPAMRLDAVVNRFVFEAHFQGRITLNGNGEQARPFLHVEKMASLIGRLLSSDLAQGTYNAVEHNFTIRELAEVVARHYSGLEMHTLNQHMEMKSLRVELPCKITQHLPLESRTFDEELAQFGQHFAF